MDKKNLDYFNNKPWYRLLKVAYVTFFVFLFSIIALGIFFGIDDINRDNTKIVCNLGNRKTFSARDIGIYLEKDDFNRGFNYKRYFLSGNEDNIKDIMKVCAEKPLYVGDVFITQKSTEINHDDNILEDEKLTRFITESKLIKDEYSNEGKSKYLTFEQEIFTIQPSFTFKSKLIYIVSTMFSLIILFELIRRIFYYIVFGKFIPKK